MNFSFCSLTTDMSASKTFSGQQPNVVLALGISETLMVVAARILTQTKINLYKESYTDKQINKKLPLEKL